MSNPAYTLLPSESWRSDALAELALNLHWSWNPSGDKLWGRLDPELWDLTRNPWLVLQTTSQEKLEAAWKEAEFVQIVDELLNEQRELQKASGWFRQQYPNPQLTSVVYFSMEYMLSEALPIYSGGLGNVAGDQLKAASDLGVPVIGVGLLYQQGYFRQEFDAGGGQRALYPFNDPGQLPITPVRHENGEWLRLQVKLPGYTVWIRAWQVEVGRTKLYLLDSNDPANPPAWRCITSELYGGGPELRFRQELMLGIGGWRLVRALGLRPEVCHLNEGHAALAVLERAYSYMEDNHQPFDVALSVTRAGNIFTTHTAVEAGFDRFPPGLVNNYLHRYADQRLGIGIDGLLALGRQNPEDRSEPFNMAYLGIRGSGAVNGVSRLHGKVSRRLFQSLFPRWPEDEVPVQYVTNGVHVPTWESAGAHALLAGVIGENASLGGLEDVGKAIRSISDASLWKLRNDERRRLIEYARARLARQRAAEGASQQEIEDAGRIFDTDTLTLGFARRFATYKRPNLLLHDPERLVRILTNRRHPVQLVLAGKERPQDGAGAAMIRQWNEFARRPEVKSRIAFLSDYDMLLTEELVEGADVWINTPQRPWEASGTSGMKVLVNGGLNLSELDGWWAEAYSPEVGWAIGDGEEHVGDPWVDATEADQLYSLIEGEITSQFYDRGQDGIPRAWVARVRESMATLTPSFSANRVVRQYTADHYIPAASAYCARSEGSGRAGAGILAWRRRIAQRWGQLRFGSVMVATSGGEHHFELQLYLGEMEPDDLRLEVFANRLDSGSPFRYPMTRGSAIAGSERGYVYSAGVPANRPITDYTPRAIPYHPMGAAPLEAPEILWQH